MAGAGRAPSTGAAAKGSARPRPGAPPRGSTSTRSTSSAPSSSTRTRPTPATPKNSSPAEPAEPAEPQSQPGIWERAKANGQRVGDAAGRLKQKPAGKKVQATAHDAGGILFGLIAYSLLINGIRYGPSGVTGWLKAKLINQPMQGLPASGAGSGGGGGPAPGDKPSESLASDQTDTSGNGVSA